MHWEIRGKLFLWVFRVLPHKTDSGFQRGNKINLLKHPERDLKSKLNCQFKKEKNNSTFVK